MCVCVGFCRDIRAACEHQIDMIIYIYMYIYIYNVWRVTVCVCAVGPRDKRVYDEFMMSLCVCDAASVLERRARMFLVCSEGGGVTAAHLNTHYRFKHQSSRYYNHYTDNYLSVVWIAI